MCTTLLYIIDQKVNEVRSIFSKGLLIFLNNSFKGHIRAIFELWSKIFPTRISKSVYFALVYTTTDESSFLL
jgi:hypothetical protein